MSCIATLILHNAHIITMDPRNPVVQAVACRHGRIVAIGHDHHILPLAGVGTTVINLHGATVIPGINDSHNHMLEVGIKMTRIVLDDVTSLDEMRDRVAAAAQHTPPGEWIIGEGWNESNLVEKRLPTCADIDAATDQHPVLLKRFFNMDVVNSVALRLAGIDAATPDPSGGAIERDASGRPNGILRAAAKSLVRDILPPETQAEAIHGIQMVSTAYLSHGITSVQDPGLYPWEIRAYLAAHQAGKLQVRTSLMPAWHGYIDGEIAQALDARAVNLGISSGLGDDMVRVTALKMAVDGGTTSRTAWMSTPFVGEHEVRDFNRLNPADLRHHFARGHDLGWDIGIHATVIAPSKKWRSHSPLPWQPTHATIATTSSMPTLPMKPRCRQWPHTPSAQSSSLRLFIRG